MNKRTKGELLIWSGVGPIGTSQGSIQKFESFVASKFGVRIDFVGDILRKDGETDTVIRFYDDCGEGSEILFRLFCVSNFIYPAIEMDHFEYEMNSLIKFLE